MFINKVLKNIKHFNRCILLIKQIDCLCALASLRDCDTIARERRIIGRNLSK